jgi:FAD/FMN-containing dehydrogenase
MSTERSAEAASRALKAQLDPDRVLLPGPAQDETLRIWNGAVDHRPALVVRCETPADVQAAVRAARTHDLPLSVRGGGHDWAGRALRPGGLVIDLSYLGHVTVDAEARVATVAGGATSGEVIAAAAAHGLCAATGTVSAVGMAGLTLGGGYGPLNGKVGLALDNLLGADVVLADGRLVTTDDTHEPELFWALRGGGGNFGVVTSMRVRLHPIPTVLAGFILFPWSQAADVLRSFADVQSDAPDELTVQCGVLSGPDGGPSLFLSPTWSGRPEEGEKAIDELQQLGTPLMAEVVPRSYGAMLGLFDAYVVNGHRYAIRTRPLAGLTPEVISALITAGATRTSPLSLIALHHFHGAATRVPPDATAFGIRRDHLTVEIVAAWEPRSGQDARHRGWTDEVSASLEPHALPGGYPNLLGPDDHEQIAQAYGENATRLRTAKARFDPDGVFSATPLPVAVPGQARGHAR